jgi:dihydroorotate dehydrogenase (fumarate)
MTIDLTTRYLGLELASPLVASPSPLGHSLEMLQRLEDAGAAAVVLPSLFEEQIEHEAFEVHRVLEAGSESFGEALSYFPELDDYNTGPGPYLDHLSAAKELLTIPVIGSLNGSSPGGWVRYAKLMQDAGADALELNVYFVATDVFMSSEQVEERYLELVRAVREGVTIPVAVKVGPYFSSMANMALRLAEAGADGLVLFNRFVQPDIDLETLSVVAGVNLSTSAELLLPLRWIAILRGRVAASLAATTGVHRAEDVLKLLLAGADVTMTTSAILRDGPERLRELVIGLRSLLEKGEYESVEQLKGSMSQASCPDPEAFERSQYMRALVSYVSDVH